MVLTPYRALTFCLTRLADLIRVREAIRARGSPSCGL